MIYKRPRCRECGKTYVYVEFSDCRKNGYCSLKCQPAEDTENQQKAKEKAINPDLFD